MDMLITGMHGQGNVGLLGCTDAQYLQHFAMWAFMGSPLIIGADIRNIDKPNKDTLLNHNLIAINQDEECRPAFCIANNNDLSFALAKILSGNKIAIGLFNICEAKENASSVYLYVSLDDLGIHSESGVSLKLTNAVTNESSGIYKDGFIFKVNANECKIFIGEIINE